MLINKCVYFSGTLQQDQLSVIDNNISVTEHSAISNLSITSSVSSSVSIQGSTHPSLQSSERQTSGCHRGLKFKLRKIQEKNYAISPVQSGESDVYDSDKDPEFNENKHGKQTFFEKSISSSSDSENTAEQVKSDTKKGKKRKQNTENWFLKKSKARRNAGLNYVSTSKTRKEYPARKMDKPCGDQCRQQCIRKIDDNQRRQIFNSYWALGDLHKQRCFIAGCMIAIKPKYRYSTTENHRDFNQAFYFDINGRIRVCKLFFKSTLGINDRPIRTVISKKKSTGVVQPDLRGHNPHFTVSADIKNGVREHINSIPRIESHYLRAQTSREYIDGGRTLTDIWRDYKQNCINAEKPHANLCMFSRIFNSEFNISFFTPKKDQCELCTAFANTEGEDKKKLQLKFDEHQREKELSRKEKNEDKSKVGQNYIVAVYDLQANLPCPRGDVSLFYYKSKLNCHNFTVTELVTNKTESYFWHEGEGKRGVEEIASCVLMFIEKTVANKNTEFDLVFFSDNCCGQQKNTFMISAYYYAIMKFPQIKSLTHKYLITGHTQNEGDSVHSVIEKQIKRTLKSGPIYIPAQYSQLIRTAKKSGNPYYVNELIHKDFYAIKALKDQLKLNFKSLKITEVKVLKIDRNNPGTLYIKTTYSASEFTEINLLKRGAEPFQNIPMLKPTYKNKLNINESKKEDLLSLLRRNHIKQFYADFFENL